MEQSRYKHKKPAVRRKPLLVPEVLYMRRCLKAIQRKRNPSKRDKSDTNAIEWFLRMYGNTREGELKHAHF